jgi:transglutaminase-like putative cysteine protease
VTRRARELELLLLPAFAALPLYFTDAIGLSPLMLFHAAIFVIAMRVTAGGPPELFPPRVMRALAIAYLPFYLIDWRALSHSAIAASTHLVLFIAVYQPSETAQRNNHAQRILTAALIFVASIATSTHITILPFVIVFAFLIFRQLMYVSHFETVQSIGRELAQPPTARTALFYVAGTMMFASAMFPFLPRLRNPFVQGFTGDLSGSTTALSETIDFREPRVSPLDSTIVARIWMDYAARPFFMPMRLRGNTYDQYVDGVWKPKPRGLRPMRLHDDGYFIARRGGIEGGAIVQTRTERGKVFLPSGTYKVDGITAMYEGPANDMYFSYSRGIVTLDVRMAVEAEPLRLMHVAPTNYPITPEISALAHRIVGNEKSPERQAALIEQWMLRNFRYVPNPQTPPAMSIERFLLKDRVGHCEYFAAGLVVLLTALDVPARIAGGYYGGRLNPLMGYFTIRRDDAHAWTEVWDGKRWLTFDSTPPSLRPGMDEGGLVGAYAAAIGDSINYFWDRYILTFGLADQINFFAELLARGRETLVEFKADVVRSASALKSRAVTTLFALLVVSGLAGSLYVRRRRSVFDLLASRLAAHGVRVSPSMTVEEAMRELSARDPQFAADMKRAVAMYEELTFSPRRDRERLRTLRRLLSS